MTTAWNIIGGVAAASFLFVRVVAADPIIPLAGLRIPEFAQPAPRNLVPVCDDATAAIGDGVRLDGVERLRNSLSRTETRRNADEFGRPWRFLRDRDSGGNGTPGPGPQNPGPQGPDPDGPGTDGPGTDGPGTDGPGTDGPGTDGPGTDGPGTDGPGTEVPHTGRHHPDVPDVGEPGTSGAEGTEEPSGEQQAGEASGQLGEIVNRGTTGASSLWPEITRGGDAVVMLANCHTPSSPLVATLEITTMIVVALNDSAEFCSNLPKGVQIDCLAERLREVARALPRNGDYAPVRAALLEASRDLDAIVEAYADPAQPARRYGMQPDTGAAVTNTRPLRAIPEENLVAANAAALSVIEETQTVLLRSAENSVNRMIHFQAISAALDSTKVLLRSA